MSTLMAIMKLSVHVSLVIKWGFGWTLGVGDGQGDLECCDSRGRKESDTTEQLNGTDYITLFICLKKSL